MSKVRKIIHRDAMVSDMLQCCEILSEFLDSSELAFYDEPWSLVEAVEELRMTREAGLPFMVLCWEDSPNEVLGFSSLKVEPHELHQFKGLSSHRIYIRHDIRGRGLLETVISEMSARCQEIPDFRGFWTQSLRENAPIRSIPSKVLKSRSIILHNGAFKGGKYIDVAFDFFDSVAVRRMKEHL